MGIHVLDFGTRCKLLKTQPLGSDLRPIFPAANPGPGGYRARSQLIS